MDTGNIHIKGTIDADIDASKITSSVIGTARLGSGSASASTFLCGNQTWATPSSTPGAGTVDTTMLKTTTGELSTGPNTPYAATVAGGSYCFWLQIRMATAGAAAMFLTHDQGVYADNNTSYYTPAYFYNGSYTMYIQSRYVTSSGEDHWMFLLTDKFTGEILSSYSAPDHPAYGNGGNFDEVSHPFNNYDVNKHQIVLVDIDTCNTLKEESILTKKSLLTLVNEKYKQDVTDITYTPMHSGKYIDDSGKHVKEIVKTIPEHIKVRKLIKMTDSESQERTASNERKRIEGETQREIEKLIEGKKRDLAIQELKKDGKLDKDGKLLK